MGVVSGSWEDLSDRAFRAADAEAPETDERFTRLITRLNKLPERVMASGDYYLVGLRDRAMARYAGYLIQQDRLDDTAALLFDETIPLDDIGAPEWLGIRARFLALVGMGEEAESLLLHLASLTVDPVVLDRIIVSLHETGRIEAALTLADRAYGRDLIQKDATLASSRSHRDGLFAYALLFAASNDSRETMRWFNRLMVVDSDYSTFIDVLASTAWNAGFSPAEIIALLSAKPLSKFQDDPQVLFWLAFAHHRAGMESQARILWTRLSQDEKLHDLEEESDLLWTWSIAKYYLGNDSSLGLYAALNVMSDEGEDASWTAFAAAAIGWAIQDDLDAALLDMRIAAKLYLGGTWRSRQLPGPWRELVEDLVPASALDALLHYLQGGRTIELVATDVTPQEASAPDDPSPDVP